MADITKEKESIQGREFGRVPDKMVTVEAPKPPDNLEAISWVEKIEKKFARVPNDTSDVTDDTVVVDQPQAQQPPVTLPITQKQMMVGKKAKTDLGVAWLVTWVVRQIKILARLGRGVRFQDLPETKEGDGRS